MARPERNAALKAQSAFAPAQSGPLAWPNQAWFQWTVGLTAIAVPAAALIASLENVDSSRVVPNLVSGLLVALNIFFIYRAMQLFDNVRTRPLRFSLGLGMKLLAVLYAFGAMYLVAVTRDNEWVLQNRGLFGGPVEVPDGVVWIVFGLSWALSALCYLVGDAHMRISRRDAAEYAGGGSPGTPSRPNA